MLYVSVVYQYRAQVGILLQILCVSSVTTCFVGLLIGYRRRSCLTHIFKQVSVYLLTYADNVRGLRALPAFARRCYSNRLISPARRAHSSKPAAAGLLLWPMLGETDGRIPSLFIDPAAHTVRARLLTVEFISRTSVHFSSRNVKLDATNAHVL